MQALEQQSEPKALTPAEFAERMAAIYPQPEAIPGQPRRYDPDGAHERADRLLVEVLRSLGYEVGCDMFDNAIQWYA